MSMFSSMRLAAAGDFAIDGDGVGRQDADVVARLDGRQWYEAQCVAVVFVHGVRQEAGEVLLVVGGRGGGCALQGSG